LYALQAIQRQQLNTELTCVRPRPVRASESVVEMNLAPRSLSRSNRCCEAVRV